MTLLKAFANFTLPRTSMVSEMRDNYNDNITLRSYFFEGTTRADAYAYLRTFPDVETMIWYEQGGTDENFKGVIPSGTYTWVNTTYPFDFGPIFWTIQSYDSEKDTTPQLLGSCVIRLPEQR